MFSHFALKDRVILVLTVVLAGFSGGLLVYLFTSNSKLNNTNQIQKVTEKQVYLESSSKIDAINSISKVLVSVVEEKEAENFAKNFNGPGCFELSSKNCGANGVILTSDGIISLSWNSLGKDYKNKSWVVFDNEGNKNDLQFIGENNRLGLVLAKMIKSGEKNLADNLRTRGFNYKNPEFSEMRKLNIGQEVVLLKNNFWNNSANAKSDMIMSLQSNLLFKNSSVIWDLDQRNDQIALAGGIIGDGVVLADLGGGLIGFETINSEGKNQIVTANELRSNLMNFEENSDWKSAVFGLKYLINNQEVKVSRGLAVDYGVLVEELSENSALFRNLGLRRSDLIIEVDGQSLLDNDFAEIMAAKTQGAKISLSILRSGKKQELKGNL